VSAVVNFLLAFTRALAVMGLYDERHPTRQGAVQHAFERLQELLREDPRPQISFLMHEVIYGQRPVRELLDWEWATRLARAGVQRLEIERAVTLEEFSTLLQGVHARIAGTAGAGAALLPTPAAGTANIRFGAVGLAGDARVEAYTSPVVPTATLSPTGALSYTLAEEIDAVRWVHGEVAAGSELPLLEADAIVRSLSVAMHGSGKVMLPLVQLKRFDQYTTTHSLNVAVLTMALAESLGFSARDVRAFGTAGLLHDVGKVRVPHDILVKPGVLTEAERAVLNRHPADGARIILQSDQDLALAAAVAYEHHIMIDGGGYPTLHFRRACHYASRVVHVCDVFDALCTDRPYRDAWEIDRVLQYIDERVGVEFDPDIARAFTAMIRRLERQVAPMEA
jgi:putative nucleotidyltransferase with HDIG domain